MFRPNASVRLSSFRLTVAIACAALIAPPAVSLSHAQQSANPNSQGVSQGIPPDQLDSLVAPIALYPDPMLAQNYSTSGAFPKRTYLSGISFQISGSTFTNSLNVWHTDNPGTTPWTLTTVDTVSSPQQLDKPSIWTSWHSATLGWTYLAAMHLNSGTNTIRVYRKTTTNAWSLVSTPFSGSSAIQSPTRNFFTPSAQDSCVGFRVAMTVG